MTTKELTYKLPNRGETSREEVGVHCVDKFANRNGEEFSVPFIEALLCVEIGS